jgi:hypothetical protein
MNCKYCHKTFSRRDAEDSECALHQFCSRLCMDKHLRREMTKERQNEWSLNYEDVRRGDEYNPGQDRKGCVRDSGG